MKFDRIARNDRPKNKRKLAAVLVAASSLGALASCTEELTTPVRLDVGITYERNITDGTSGSCGFN